MSTTDYLETARSRSLADDSKVSEAELHATNPGIKEGWETLQALRREIAQRKQEASKAIDAEFAERFKEATESYALLLQMTR